MKIKIGKKKNNIIQDISKEESALLSSYFKDVQRKTEKETARFRSGPDLDKLYSYILKREKERKTRFERILFPLKIVQILSFICLGGLAAFILWSKKPEITAIFDKAFGIEKASNKIATSLSSPNLTFLLIATGLAMLILILFSYFTLKTDKPR
jgi:hypothetical protein